ncbi:MAG TPA: hypothetical protein VK574_21385 [Terracidiphilus sp.]|nr:hypothetical protein [Terracidiphilus sp.]
MVTFKFSVGTPTAVAARIGSGAFTAQALNSGTLSLTIPNGTANFAVAYVCTLPLGPQAQVPEQFVFEASTADGSSFTEPCPVAVPSSQTGTFTGSVDASGIPGATLVDIAASNGTSTAVAGAALNGAFSLVEPAGADRVMVLAYNNSQQGLLTSLVAAKNFTNQTVPGALNGGSTVVLGAADETTPQAITYNNAPPGYSAPTTVVGFIMGGAGGFTVAAPATTQYPALPAAAVQGGDFYKFLATVISSSKQGEEVLVLANSSSGGPVTFTFPAPWSYRGPTPAALPNFNFAYTGFAGKPGVIESAAVGWVSGTGVSSFFEVDATANYQSGSTALAFPDLSGVAGFQPAPTSGSPAVWTAEIVQFSAGATLTMPSNATGNAVANSGTYTVP